ncbi:chemotaxis protein CheC [Pullulanibacillus pueri]|uniref:CheY-P phosphatase CheC n=1 Tax=Pullulanibacillus pueri TaxID=1437324 RepID=A0A8J2ZW06_9BACL|nr:chemotaxis protein CheC [Pullulanibacillus pueri]MBM7682500.1 chemotaxis protein CheC [Pullulanibacillus pueri]GGH82150.1 CheY-P phosphatase CheC [Pullulanibacillus pueri]
MQRSLRQLTPEHLDIVKEIANIGSGHAATSLSKILEQRIDMAVPSVEIASFSDLLNMDDAETPVVAAYLKMSGALPGHLFIMFDLGEVDDLMKPMLRGNPLNAEELLVNPLYSSFLGEIGNIMAGAYISALSDFSGRNSYLSPPQVCVDMKSAVLSEGILDLSLYEDQVMVINAVLSNGETHQTIHSAFTLLPELSGLSSFIELLEGKNG